MLCVMMLPLSSSSVAHQSSLSVSAATITSGVDNAASPTGRQCWPDYFTLREADHYAKQLEGTQKYINDSVDRVAHIDGQLIIIVST